MPDLDPVPVAETPETSPPLVGWLDRVDPQRELQLVLERRSQGWLLGVVEPTEPGTEVSIRMRDGSIRTAKSLPSSFMRVREGMLAVDVAEDAAGVADLLQNDPLAVVLRLLQEVGRPQSKKEVEERLSGLRLQTSDGWWTPVLKQLKGHDHVVQEGPRFRWTDSPVPRNAETKKPRPTPKAVAPVVNESIVRPSNEGAGERVLVAEPHNEAHESPPTTTFADLAAKTGLADAEGLLTLLLAVLDSDGSVEARSRLREAISGQESIALAGLPQLAAAPPTAWEEARWLAIDVSGLPAYLLKSLAKMAIRRGWVQLALTIGLTAGEFSDTLGLVASGELLGWLPVLVSVLEAPNAPQVNPELLAGLCRLIQAQVGVESASSALELVCVLMPDATGGPSAGHGRALIELAGASVSVAQAKDFAEMSRSRLLRLLEGLRTLGAEREWSWILRRLSEQRRDDVLGAEAVWSQVDLLRLMDEGNPARVMTALARSDRAAELLVKRAVDRATSDHALGLAGLPDALLAQVPAASLARLLEQRAEHSPAFSRLLETLGDRRLKAHAQDDELAGVRQQIAEQLRELERARADLLEERSLHARTTTRLQTVRQATQDTDRVALDQAKVQALRLAVQVAEEVRLSHSDDGLWRRTVSSLQTAGIEIIGTASEQISYDPARFQVLGEDVALDEGSVAVVVRPAYVLSEGTSRVLQYGQVRAE